jgi:hypothetical protein
MFPMQAFGAVDCLGPDFAAIGFGLDFALGFGSAKKLGTNNSSRAWSSSAKFEMSGKSLAMATRRTILLANALAQKYLSRMCIA